MLVDKDGTHFTTAHRVCGECGHLDGHVCPVVAHLGACRGSLSAPFFESDIMPVDAALSVEFSEFGVYFSALLGVLQHGSGQLECERVHSG
jgi:hypothetical protein